MVAASACCWRSGESACRDHAGRVMDLPEGEVRRCLGELAWRAHADQAASGNARDAADIPATLLDQAFRPLLDLNGRRDLIDYLRGHAGVLISREEDRFAFPHRAFQEYLAMCHLDAQVEDSLVATTAADPLWWREVFRLAVASQRRKPRNGLSLVRDLMDLMDRVADADATTAWRIAILAGLALLELDLSSDDRRDATHQLVRRSLVVLIEDPAALDPPERLDAGLALGGIGDPRPRVGLRDDGLPDIDWVEVPEQA